MMRRRSFLKNAAMLGAVSSLPLARLAFARAETDARFVFIILRGGLDGLAAVPAFGDPDYGRQRGRLALDTTGQRSILKLDSDFGLHPSLAGLHELYGAGELIVFHAIATPYRKRSHFDAQDLLENGLAIHGRRQDGWLNRALRVMPGDSMSAQGYAIAMSMNAPLVMRGEYPVNTWSPSKWREPDDSTLDRIARMYASYPALAGRLAEGRAMQALASATVSKPDKEQRGAVRLSQTAGTFLAEEDGPRIAAIEFGGWDTHAGQGSAQGNLSNRLRRLDQNLLALRDTLGPSWRNTTVLVVTEFGRTVAVNGSQGTDHGTAGCAFLLGGAVKGGRVLTDWPGLSPQALYEGRDLRPTTDLRAVFKGVLAEQFDLPDATLARTVFPDSANVKPMRGLVVAANTQ
jgi:uncharacterized protein (DUF1501 family)